MELIATQIYAQEIEERFGRKGMERVLKMLDILAGKLPPPIEPMQKLDVPVFFPDIMNQPWYSCDFPWMRHLEANYKIIREELQVMLDDQYQFGQYGRLYEVSSDIPQKDIQPVAGWDAFYFYRNRQPVEKSCEMCPRTAELLKSVPVAQEVLFSIMRPGTHIPEHSDDLNFLATYHLGLKVPEGCSIRVGTETRSWEEGKIIAFNTTFRHEAWNRSNETRVVLLMDVWHPDLTPVEIEAMEFLIPKLERALGLTPNIP